MGRYFASLKVLIKFLIRSACAEFSFSRVHVIDLSRLSSPDDARVREIKVDHIKASPCAEISARAGENYRRASLLGIWDDGELAGYVACFPANTYRDIALPQGLQCDEVLVNRFLVAPEKRNRGFGGALLENSFRILAQRGYRRAYAVVWHNNWPSIRAFHKAGTTLDHSIVVIRLRFWRRPFYFRTLTKSRCLTKILAAPVLKWAGQP